MRTMTRLKTVLKRSAAVGAVAVGLLTATANPAQASWYPATTGGDGANLRTCASTNCGQRGYVPGWTGIRIVCQVQGQRVRGYYGTSDLWNYVVWENGPGRPEGFAADANINTGHSYWIPGIEVCR